MVKFTKMFRKLFSYMCYKVIKCFRFSYLFFELRALSRSISKSHFDTGMIRNNLYVYTKLTLTHVDIVHRDLSTVSPTKLLIILKWTWSHSHQPIQEKILFNGSSSGNSCFNQLSLTHFTVEKLTIKYMTMWKTPGT